MNKILFAIRSRTDINFLDIALSENHVNHRIINTPFELKLSCGLSIVVDESRLETVKQVARRECVKINGIYRIVQAKYRSEYFKIE